jgi:hypothetical protein
MYGMAILPLIKNLNKNEKVTQNWYADDASAVGKLEDLKSWLIELMQHGPDYGYFPEPSKSYLVARKEFEKVAKDIFQDPGVTVVSGRRLLGGFIGSEDDKQEYVADRVASWSHYVKILADTAKETPHQVFSAFTKSLQFEWAYLQRVIPNCADKFVPLEQSIKNILLPAILGGEVSETERRLFSLPTRMGGLGITNPTETAPLVFTTSPKATG